MALIYKMLSKIILNNLSGNFFCCSNEEIKKFDKFFASRAHRPDEEEELSDGSHNLYIAK